MGYLQPAVQSKHSDYLGDNTAIVFDQRVYGNGEVWSSRNHLRLNLSPIIKVVFPFSKAELRLCHNAFDFARRCVTGELWILRLCPMAFTQKRKTLANSFGHAYCKKKIQSRIELLDWPTIILSQEISLKQVMNFYKAFKDFN